MWSRSKSTVLVPACLLLFSLAAAEEGAFVSREQARAAIERAERNKADSEARYTQARRDCEGTFLVNSCLEQARSDHRRRTQEIRAREAAARDAMRGFDADERARARVERSAREAPPGRPRSPAETDVSTRPPPAPLTTAPSTLHVPPGDAARAALEEAADAERRRAKSEQRAAAQTEDRARHEADQGEQAAQRAAQIERYEQRQRDAKAREEEKLRVAKENERRREKRRLERERAVEEARRQPAQQ